MEHHRVTSDGDFVSLSSSTLDISSLTDRAQKDSAGAVSVFIGTTRNTFEEKEVISLEYEAYEDMALEEMVNMCMKVRTMKVKFLFGRNVNLWNDLKQLRTMWDLERIVIQHKLGACPVGDKSVVIAISSRHRKESLEGIILPQGCSLLICTFACSGAICHR